jgi:hypothetical protein
MMDTWLVVSPEMWVVVPVLDDGSGPREYYCNYVEVKAENRCKAITAALKTKEFQAWKEWQKDSGEGIRKGVSAKRRKDV